MAASPHVKVRLSPFYLAGLEMIASRHGEHEATWAGHALRAAIEGYMADQGAREAWQQYYMAQLDERQAERERAAAARQPHQNPAAPRRRRAV